MAEKETIKVKIKPGTVSEAQKRIWQTFWQQVVSQAKENEG